MSTSAPLTGKRVSVIGTSRADLNGQRGLARDFDSAKGRYNVVLEPSGQVVSLRPQNLQSASGDDDGSPTRILGLPWQQAAMIALAAMWLYQVVFAGVFSGGGDGGSESLWGASGDEKVYADSSDAYMEGQVLEVTNLEQFRGVIGHHGDSTGLPVVIDFYSQSCGPCRSIAPAYRRLAKELKGRLVFLKVDVNRNYETSSVCRVRSMPTFQFYHGRSKVREFAGADERLLRRYSHDLLDMADEQGTYVDQLITADSLREFYGKHDPAKVEEADRLAEKYQNRTALLARVSLQKYGEVPKATSRGAQAQSSPSSSSPSSEAVGSNESSLGELDMMMRFVAVEELISEEPQQTIIIGGGPAGLASAIYAARAGLRPVVVAPMFGGQLLGKGVEVENYPGVIGELANGPSLVDVMRHQALSFDARFLDAAVLDVNLSRSPFQVKVNGSDAVLHSRTLILASGAESRWLDVAGESDFRGRGVSACATCDGYLYRGRDVAVIGGGDTAMEDALHLARTCRQVTIIHRRDKLRASRILQDRVLNHSNIKVLWDSVVESFRGTDELTHLRVLTRENTQDSRPEGATTDLAVAGAFVAIGHDPQTAFLRKQLELDAAGYIVLRGGRGGGTATSVPGVFAAGDIADSRYRQAVTASGTGAMAALDVEHFLNEELP